MSDRRKLQIVWVDDRVTSLVDPILLLSEEGIATTTIGSYEEALSRTDEIRKADVVIIDLLLPDPEQPWKGAVDRGADLATELRNRGVTTPMIAFSIVAADYRKQNDIPSPRGAVLRNLGAREVPKEVPLPRLIDEIRSASMMKSTG